LLHIIRDGLRREERGHDTVREANDHRTPALCLLQNATARPPLRHRCKQHHPSTAPSIRKRLGPKANVVRQRVSLELHGLDLAAAQTQGLRDAMHPIHNGTVGREDDRERKIRLIHEPHMESDAPPGQHLLISHKRRIKLTQLLERYPPAGQIRRQRDKPINIPRKQAAL
jgi:hypothetical protein